MPAARNHGASPPDATPDRLLLRIFVSEKRSRLWRDDILDYA
jgi:hypothetical protein